MRHTWRVEESKVENKVKANSSISDTNLLGPGLPEALVIFIQQVNDTNKVNVVIKKKLKQIKM